MRATLFPLFRLTAAACLGAALLASCMAVPDRKQQIEIAETQPPPAAPVDAAPALPRLASEHFAAAFPDHRANPPDWHDGPERIKQRYGEPKLVWGKGGLYTAEQMEQWLYEQEQTQWTLLWDAEYNLLSYSLVYPHPNRTETVRFEASSDGAMSTRTSTVPVVPAISLPTVWTFSAELPFVQLVGAAGDLLLLRADDGQLSGAHEASYLYGISKTDGKERFRIDGRYLGTPFAITQDRTAVAVLTHLNPDTKKPDHHLRMMRVSDGAIMWEKHWLDDGPTYSLTGAAGTVIVAKTRHDASGTLYAFRDSDGALLWEKPLQPNEAVWTDTFAKRAVVVASESGLTGYDPLTGEWRWETTGTLTPQSVASSVQRYVDLLFQDEGNFAARDNDPLWVLVDEQLVLFDAVSGKRLFTYPHKQEQHYTVIDADTLLVQQANTAPYWRGDTFTTRRVNLSDGQTMWEQDGRLSFGVRDGNALFVTWNGQPRLIDAATGNVRWTGTASPAAVEWTETNKALSDRQLVATDNSILLPGYESVLLYDRATGKLIYRILSNMQTVSRDLNGNSYNGLRTVDGVLYMATSDGKLHQADVMRIRDGSF